MGSYLLKADDADLARWKADAERAGVKFAEHIRRRLDGHGSTDVGAATGRTDSPATNQPEQSTMRPLTDDPKPPSTKAKVAKSRPLSARCPHGRQPDEYCSRCDPLTRA